MKYWYQKNLRFLQTVLREIDIINYDAKKVVDYMRRANANVLVVNAGGIMDFFDNPLPLANVNPSKTHENVLRDIGREIHAAGMRVIVRVDFRGVDPQRYAQHPDWFAAEPDGGPRAGHGHIKLCAPCYNSYYANEHAEEYIRYVLSTFDLDGIWENALGFHHGPCYCKRCRDRYFEATGKQIPLPTGDPDEYGGPRFDEYRAWKATCADAHIARMRAAVKSFGEEKAYCAEIFDIYNHSFTTGTGVGYENAKRHFDFLVSCVFLNPNNPRARGAYRVYDLIHDGGSHIRVARALQPEKQPVIVTGGNGSRWRYITDPALETRLWMWEIASSGGGIWNCYFNGSCPAMTHDRRAAYSEQDVYTYLAQNSDLISDSKPVSEVAIYYSPKTGDRFGSSDETKDLYGVGIKGVERVLTENHVQYGFVVADGLKPEHLEGVKALLMPNAAVMSDAEIEIIRQYVQQGGALIASYETSLYTPEGAMRRNFGLADVFGCDYSGYSVDTQEDCYLLVAERENPVLANLGDTEMLINGGHTALCMPHENTHVAARYIPVIHNQPPEYAWIRRMDSDFSVIHTHAYGKGRVVYYANTADAQCYLNGHEDYTELYKNALDYAIGGQYLVQSDAPRSVHINMLVQQADDGRYVLSVINETGASQRPMKEVVPVGPFDIRLNVPSRQLKAARMLWGDEITAVQQDGMICLRVERLNEFGSIAIELT